MRQNWPPSAERLFRTLIDEVRKANRPRRFVFPRLSGTVDDPQEGDAWIDGSTNTVKIIVNGVVKTFTIT